MKISETSLPGVLLIEPKVFGDGRGFFYESWNLERFGALGLGVSFVQDNVSFSKKGVLRGLHFQNPNPQAKLVSVCQGEVFDVAVDLRTGSPSFGKWFGALLSAENHRQLFVPAGFAHGFMVTSETALFSYKCGDYYAPASDLSLRWDDRDIGIEWPSGEKLLSAKDEAAPTLAQLQSSGRLYDVSGQ